MISTGEIVIIIALIIILIVVLIYFYIAYNYGLTLKAFSYARGANLDVTTLDNNGKLTGKGTVIFQCDTEHSICIERATAICTGALRGGQSGALDNTEAGPEPISGGQKGNSSYGNFDVKNTVDLTSSLVKLANGKSSYTYNFDYTNVGLVCPINGQCSNKALCPPYNPKDNSGLRPQVIATYTCVPIGQSCKIAIPHPSLV